jgi:hypothetical protein
VIGRRALLGCLLLAACGHPVAVAPEAPRAPRLKLDPLVDLVPAADLVWLLDARLEELLASPSIASAVSLLVPAARFDAFAERHGGVDLRRVTQLVVAGYPEATLALACVPVQDGRVETAFAARADHVEGRAVEGAVTRLWGSAGEGREQVAVFDGRAVGLEHGHLGPLRAAIYFAQGKLKRALPALRAEPLVRAVRMVGDAPLRAFAPGPFDGAWGAGLGGLLRATTAIGAGVRYLERPPHGALEVQGVLAGAWGGDAARAAERLAAAFQLLANDPLGRLLGIDHPLEEARVSGDDEALRLQVVLDPLALARGLEAATGARIAEIMAY